MSASRATVGAYDPISGHALISFGLGTPSSTCLSTTCVREARRYAQDRQGGFEGDFSPARADCYFDAAAALHKLAGKALMQLLEASQNFPGDASCEQDSLRRSAQKWPCWFNV